MNTQMATPISSLPLKTSQPANESELEDPMIQNVLKEFEDEMAQTRQNNEQQSQYTPQQGQQSYQHQYQQPQLQSQYNIPGQQQYISQQPYVNDGRKFQKLFNMDIAKKTLVITIIVVLFQHNNLLNLLISRLPEAVNNYISGRELLLNFAIVFLIIYVLFYTDLL